LGLVAVCDTQDKQAEYQSDAKRDEPGDVCPGANNSHHGRKKKEYEQEHGFPLVVKVSRIKRAVPLLPAKTASHLMGSGISP
jgi:hypothetical protein